MQQLEINAKEMDTANEELGLIESNENENYDMFTSNLNNKRRTQSEQQASNALKNAKTIDEAKKEALEREEIEKAKKLSTQSEGKKMINNIMNKITPTIEITTKPAATAASNKTVSSKKSSNVLESILPETVDEFNRFLEDSTKTNEVKNQINNNTIDSDNDEENKNPMVLNYSENTSSDDDQKLKIAKPIILNDSSSDDDKKIYKNPIVKSTSPESVDLRSRNKIEVDN